MRRITSVYWIGLISLSSCLSVQRFTIEVQEPAQVTFPADIRNILIVDNSAKQPSAMGITRVYNGVQVEGFELKTDSIAWIAAFSAAKNIRASRFFDQVLFYKIPLREDSDWLATVPLDKTLRDDIFQTYNLDGIISIDRMLTQLEGSVRNNMPELPAPFAHFVEAQSNATLACSIYLYNSENPLTTVTLSDSLSFQETFFVQDNAFFLKEIPESLLNELAYRLGEKLARYMFPSWVQKERIVYTGYDSRMQEALSFMRNKKWNKAEAIWLNAYNSNSQPLSKGKQANNIAVANEMQDQLDLALRWALTAEELFSESRRSPDSNERTWINAYIADLRKRIQDNQLLNIQWGMETGE
jgi:hypothetical protein